MILKNGKSSKDCISCMNKYLIIVNSRFQLMEAIHIRREMLEPSCTTTLILVGNQFDHGYVKRLRGSFDSVYIVDEDYFTRKERVCFFFYPAKALLKLGISSLELFTDIFFYNPTRLVYYIRKHELNSGTNYVWHVLQDGLSSYILSPDKEYYESLLYGNTVGQKVIKYVDKIIWGFSWVVHDEYMWSRRFKMCSCSHPIIEIPPIHLSDEHISEINNIFDYHPICIESKYIYLDVGYGYTYDSYANQCLKQAVDCLGNSMTVIPHPSVDTKQYDFINGKSIIGKNMYPWELVCVNNDLKDKIVIGSFSGALINPILIADATFDVYVILGNMQSDQSDKRSSYKYTERYIALMNEMATTYSNYHIVKDFYSICGGKNNDCCIANR